MSSEQEFWQQETARRMAEYNARVFAEAARQRASAPEPHWTQHMDQRRHDAMAEASEQQQRWLDARHAEHVAAYAAVRAKEGPRWSDIDWNGLSVVEQQHQAQQAADRQRRWETFCNSPDGRAKGWRGYPEPQDWFE
jgi:hypothetical protein